jgi:integrase
MRLLEYVNVYASQHEYGLRGSSLAYMRSAVGSLETFAGRQIDVTDLTPCEFNRFLDFLRENRRPDTFRTVRGAILTLWRHAHVNKHTTIEPVGLRKIRIRRRSPTAWTPIEVETLIRTAHGRNRSRMPCGIAYAIWWESLIRTAYDTGMRLGDLLSISRSQITRTKDGAVVKYQASKTEDECYRRLRPTTLAVVDQAIRSNNSHPELIWPLWASRDAFYRQFRSLVAAAGIRKGTFRYIRRTAVTWADIQTPGLGQQVAGHKNERVTAESYRDVTQIGQQLPAPPDLQDAVNQYRQLNG